MMSKQHYEYDITGSIVLYKTNPAELEQAVRCFMGSCLRSKMVIVDNSPTDELRPLCRDLGTEYIFPGKNLGFGAAHNIALNNSATSKYHVVLNPDVMFGCTVIQEIITVLELNEAVGLVMPRVLYPDGSFQKLCKRLPTPFDILAKRVFPELLKGIFYKRLSAFELCDMDMTKVLSVPYLSGCFMLLRRDALREVGLFDERFFMYFEDLDLTRRIHECYQTLYYPHVTITHRHEKGSYKSAKLLFHGIISMILYFNKWGWVQDRKRDVVNSAIGPVESLVGLPERLVLTPFIEQ
jgi:GT2 family glycosyltransferase